MPLLARMVHAPLAIQIEPDALARIGQTMADLRISPSGRMAVAVGPGMGPRVADVLRQQLDHAEIIGLSGGTLDAAVEFGEKLRAGPFEAVVAVGGGKIIDTVKYAASQHGMPMVAVATSLSHDGIASPVSVLDRNGRSHSYGVQTPLAVIVDLTLVGEAPVRQLRAGIGDALSNLSAVADWQLAHEAKGEPVDGLAVALAMSGAEALLHHPGNLGDHGFLATLANALILGGVAMAVAGSSRPCSGGCHEISHAIDSLYAPRHLHGEQVAVGALFCTYLHGDEGRLRRQLDTYARHGLPRTPSDLGLSLDQFVDAVAFAPSTRPGRYTILEHLGLDSEAIFSRTRDFIKHCA